ncbi:Hypothetical predicted protein [Marmota monax]|uniref:Uncharacterized protein n=1 Tax=Marmota monax TaxID=9995 RepID=A0A5E4CTP2_MARMO|nr:hypothetical protein GHT09_003907 [Marmota monax]VTJ84381.1 Hypothetical predicted protein [Marmota monax]
MYKLEQPWEKQAAVAAASAIAAAAAAPLLSLVRGCSPSLLTPPSSSRCPSLWSRAALKRRLRGSGGRCSRWRPAEKKKPHKAGCELRENKENPQT